MVVIVVFLICAEMTFYAIMIMIIFWYLFMRLRFINRRRFRQSPIKHNNLLAVIII